MINAQIFGLKNSSATRAAERFFKERRVAIHFVDLKQKPMSPGEINRFVQKFGLAALIDKSSKLYEAAGLQYMKVSDAEMLLKIEREPGLLRLPLVRIGKHLHLGDDAEGWKQSLAAAAQSV